MVTHDPVRTQVWDVAAGLPQVIQIERGGASPDTFNFTYGLGRIAHVDASDVTHYYLADALGSVKDMRNSSGVSDAGYEYTAFGDQTAFPFDGPDNEFTFTGEQDPLGGSSGLIYLRARWYDPETGRFLRR